MKAIAQFLCILFITAVLLLSCKQKDGAGSGVSISKDLGLKEGALISCGPDDKRLGTVSFDMSCSGEKADFEMGVKLLHSFEYDEAEKSFAKVIDANPHCAMGYWGVAMANFHALWNPPTQAELIKGSKAIAIARKEKSITPRELAYVNAIGSFYDDWEHTDHLTRCLRFEQSMAKLHADYPDDKEASIFYALALDAAADPTDKTYANQKKAGALLNSLYPEEPDHPGIIHYIIHTYDYPGLATLALPAARRYAQVAPSSAHALHMPSHIFTRLGLWDECIASNLTSVASAKCYAESAGFKGHWDEELHGLDYLVYAYLQKGNNDSAKIECDYLQTITQVFPTNSKVAYSFAAIPCRYAIENKDWKAAANVPLPGAGIHWADYPWQEAMIHFTRLLGHVHMHDQAAAEKELATLNSLHDKLVTLKDSYKSNQVLIQIRAGEAWISFMKGNQQDALAKMKESADMEEHTEKNPVTPCELIPARELLGDLLMETNHPQEALEAYKTDLYYHPNRFNGLLGAGRAALKAGQQEIAKQYFSQLFQVAGKNAQRPELKELSQYQ